MLKGAFRPTSETSAHVSTSNRMCCVWGQQFYGRQELLMNVAVIARPLQTSARWLIAGAIAVALFAAALVHSAPVGAAVWCGGQYTTYCPLYAGYYPGYAGYAGYAGYPYGYAPNAATFRQYTD